MQGNPSLPTTAQQILEQQNRINYFSDYNPYIYSPSNYIQIPQSLPTYSPLPNSFATSIGSLQDMNIDSGEKRRRRRESHNAVERRRRDTINDNIQELNSLLPEDTSHQKLNKGTILKRAVDYVKLINVGVGRLQDRNKELESLVLMLCRDGHVDVNTVSSRLSYPLGTSCDFILGTVVGVTEVVQNTGEFELE